MRVSGGQARHLVRVLRLGPGNQLAARDPAGGDWSCVLDKIEGGATLTVRMRCSPAQSAETEDQGIQIHVLQAVPKGRKLDTVVRAATEAGAASITVFCGSRSVAALPSKDRIARLRAVISEASEQSGALLPALLTAADLGSAIRRVHRERSCAQGLILHASPVPHAGDGFHGLVHRAAGNPISLAVGPEGGFTETELDEARASGMIPVYLGPPVLRTEHAALYALGALRQIAREQDRWRPVSESLEA